MQRSFDTIEDMEADHITHEGGKTTAEFARCYVSRTTGESLEADIVVINYKDSNPRSRKVMY